MVLSEAQEHLCSPSLEPQACSLRLDPSHTSDPRSFREIDQVKKIVAFCLFDCSSVYIGLFDDSKKRLKTSSFFLPLERSPASILESRMFIVFISQCTS